MALGEKIINELNSIILDNIFIVILMVTMVLFFMDMYHRFIRVNKETDEVNIAQRYCWVTYYRNAEKRRKNG